MANVVWKQSIDAFKEAYEFPKDTKFLKVDFQNDELQLWYQCDPDAPKEYRFIRRYTTGAKIYDPERLIYIGTAMTNNQAFVIHVYEAKP